MQQNKSLTGTITKLNTQIKNEQAERKQEVPVSLGPGRMNFMQGA